MGARWRVSHEIGKIFASASITMSVRLEGRRNRTPEASFHSLRHTFVSLAANAGVPLPVVQSIVGHCSTAMTRHYYHENEADLRRAVEAIPTLDGRRVSAPVKAVVRPEETPESRLKKLGRLLAKALITQDEYAAHRTRILAAL